MKLLLSSLMIAVAVAVDEECSFSDGAAAGIQMATFLGTDDMLAKATGCGGFVMDNVMVVSKMEDFQTVMGVQAQFCDATNDCNVFIDALTAQLKTLEVKYPACHKKLAENVGTQMGMTGVDDVTAGLETAKASVCGITCAATDARCWTCEGAELMGDFSESLNFCAKIPWCKASAGSCDNDPSKKCPGTGTLDKFKDAITQVSTECGDVAALTACGAGCKTAVTDFVALTKTANKAEFKATALLCLEDAAGLLAETVKTSMADLHALMPSLTTGMDGAMVKDLLDGCKITAEEVTTAEALQVEALTVSVTADEAQAAADASSAAAVVPAASLLLATAVLFA